MKSLFLTLFLIFQFQPSKADICASYLNEIQVYKEVNKQARLKLMLEGSANMSRTLKSKTLKDWLKNWSSEKRIAKANFKSAAEFVLDHYESLPLNLETAVILNKMITKDLVPLAVWGDYNFRTNSGTAEEARPFHLYPKAFYEWLERPEAQRMALKDPMELAEIAHHTISALDSFIDGNGRLSRLFADLILLKAGYEPIAYPSIDEYFAKGNSRSPVSRLRRKAYFKKLIIQSQN